MGLDYRKDMVNKVLLFTNWNPVQSQVSLCQMHRAQCNYSRPASDAHYDIRDSAICSVNLSPISPLDVLMESDTSYSGVCTGYFLI